MDQTQVLNDTKVNWPCRILREQFIQVQTRRLLPLDVFHILNTTWNRTGYVSCVHALDPCCWTCNATPLRGQARKHLVKVVVFSNTCL